MANVKLLQRLTRRLSLPVTSQNPAPVWHTPLTNLIRPKPTGSYGRRRPDLTAPSGHHQYAVYSVLVCRTRHREDSLSMHSAGQARPATQPVFGHFIMIRRPARDRILIPGDHGQYSRLQPTPTTTPTPQLWLAPVCEPVGLCRVVLMCWTAARKDGG